jgi:hypothetical protein
MQNKLCFVQFIHPGGEHRPDSRAVKRWNREAHKRKFVKQPGRYIADSSIHDGVVAFWGEWEPESRVVKEILNPIPDGPRYIYEPFYVEPASYQGLQNTDPFVFGEHFYYTGCQQRTKKGPTQLHWLSRGSVILFGSCLDKNRFVLDTLFVVDDWIDHNKNNYKKVLGTTVSQGYAEVTIAPWYEESSPESESGILNGSQESWRLYSGAGYENSVQGMYSFFPCVPYEDGSKGFARPVITLPRAITNNLCQGKRLNPQSSIEEVKALWNEVVAQVQEQGLAFGVYAQMPSRNSRL